MGLLITPNGTRLPFVKHYHTKDSCKQKKLTYHRQTELAADLIGELPLPAVHQERREVHSVGKVRLAFSTKTRPLLAKTLRTARGAKKTLRIVESACQKEYRVPMRA